MLQGKEKIIANLKAAMWENGNVERLIAKAVRAYIDERYVSQPRDVVELYVQETYVEVTNVPHIAENGELYENVLLMTELEHTLVELYEGEQVPEQLNFDDLLG